MHVGHMREAERAERREIQWDAPRNVADRVAAAIAVGCGVGQFTDTDAVKNGEKNSLDQNVGTSGPENRENIVHRRLALAGGVNPA